MKYDDMSWHIEGDFPTDVAESAAATHIGFFAAWSWLHGLGGASFSESVDELSSILKERSLSPGQLIIRFCDGKLTDEDLNEEGNRFAAAYYEDNENGYGDDYVKNLVENLPSFYHVVDNWNNYSRIEPVIDERFKRWAIKFKK